MADEALPRGEWIDLAVGHAFVMQTLPGSRFLSAAGTDSFVGEIRGSEFTLQMDFGRYFTGLHVPEVAITAIGPVKLILSGAVRRERTHAVLLRMFATIRFKPRT